MPMCSCTVCLTRVTPVLCHAGSTEDLWKRIWDRYGRCTRMTIAEYFTFIATKFDEYDANVSPERVGWTTRVHCCCARPTFLHVCTFCTTVNAGIPPHRADGCPASCCLHCSVRLPLQTLISRRTSIGWTGTDC